MTVRGDSVAVILSEQNNACPPVILCTRKVALSPVILSKPNGRAEESLNKRQDSLQTFPLRLDKKSVNLWRMGKVATVG